MNLWKQLWRIVRMTRRVGGWKAAGQLASEAPKQIALFRLLLLDARVPVAAKAVLLAAVVFAFSPLNIPNYIPVLGALDDIGIVLFAGNYFLKQVPAAVLAEHRHKVGLSESPDMA
jgi:uncharacterized membrane protein YkvA (DUF1232 family)